MQNGNCEVKFVETKLQLADIFTKPLPKERFFFLRNELGILDLNNLSEICLWYMLKSICEDK